MAAVYGASSVGPNGFASTAPLRSGTKSRRTPADRHVILRSGGEGLPMNQQYACSLHPPARLRKLGRVDPFDYSGQALCGIKPGELRSIATTTVGVRCY